MLFNQPLTTVKFARQGLVKGKIDQKNGIFRVKDSVARDVEPGKLVDLILKLESWCEHIKRKTLHLIVQTGAKLVQYCWTK